MRVKQFNACLLLFCGVCGTVNVIAQDKAEGFVPPSSRIYEEVLVTGGKEGIADLAGSATFVDKEAIEKFDTTDLTSLLGQVPGVYFRQEDGYGLRANIGLRGTSTERSTKITMMEDGVLIGPAPYSAPAAYYTPTINRMYALEVFKGPSAIRYGPHTVGGAINFVTRPIGENDEGELGLTVGDYGLQKINGYYANSGEKFSWSMDALSHSADGFKELDYGGDTGFVKNDFNGRMRWQSSKNAKVHQELEIKLGYADEDSHETYLGLAESDFAITPNRRYAASQLDNFVSDHQQIHVFHSVDFGNSWKLFTKAYLNRFDRSWNKFDGMIGGNDILTILANPVLFEQEYQLVTGEADSNRSSGLRIDITDNHREYSSSGVEFNVSRELEVGAWTHELQSGVLLHQDYVERDHSQRGYFMESQTLVFDGDETRRKKALNKGEADALAFYVKDEMRYDRWLFNLGFRYESIDTLHTDFLFDVPTQIESRQTAIMPGAGVVYDFTEYVSLLAGVNKGFSPKSASTAEEVEPEESVNVEYGLRFENEISNAEIIGFYSDYSNLLGRCRITDTSCEGDINGGSVEISGVELNAQYVYAVSEDISFPLSFVYTMTDANFLSSFDSEFNQWGDVEEGDELPYLPDQQGRIQVGIAGANWSTDLALRYIGEMREVAGSGPYIDGEYVQALTTIDIAAEYQFASGLSCKLIAENVTDEQEVVSRRPLAARPNHPRMIKAGVKFSF